jgi:predicted PurR-regulated permease PerM
MPDPESVNTGGGATSPVVESAIRIGLLALLVFWCLLLIRPFLIPIVWGLVIAVAGYPTYRSLRSSLRGREIVASAVFSLLLFLAIVIPAALLGGTLVEGARGLLEQLREGQLQIPEPPPGVAEWPLVGDQIAEFWTRAADNLEPVLLAMAPHLKQPAQWLLGVVAGTGLGLLQFLFAIVIAGAVLTRAERAAGVATTIARRLAGSRGQEFAALAGATVRSVTRGILGVALIQATLAGLGFLAAGVPAAGLWALIALVLSVVQIGVFPVLLPILVYVFFTADTLTFALFLIWSLFVGVIDNVLKPVFLGRGVTVPMWVVFLGAIGGLLSHGLIGLFVGPVVLVLGYALLLAWIQAGPLPATDAGITLQAGTGPGDADNASQEPDGSSNRKPG